MFDNGSYWVYDNSTNGIVDSVYVVNCDFEIRSYKSGSGCSGSLGAFEFVNTEFQSTLFGPSTTSMYNDMIAPEKLALYEYRLFDCDQMVIVDTLHLASQTFSNVQMIETINPSAKLYYKKDIGILRKIVFDTIHDSTVFDLIDYNVIQFTIPE
jgi:hypothetical protein